jgi:DNA (cytosine-5)-methyltransferase 1
MDSEYNPCPIDGPFGPLSTGSPTGSGRPTAVAVAGTLAASGAGSSRPAGNANETDLVVPVCTFDPRNVTSKGNRTTCRPELGQTLHAEPMHVIGSGVRRLTPIERERLQGFPDGWTEGFADSVRYRMLGNAVCVPVASWIGRRLIVTAKASREAA